MRVLDCDCFGLTGFDIYVAYAAMRHTITAQFEATLRHIRVFSVWLLYLKHLEFSLLSLKKCVIVSGEIVLKFHPLSIHSPSQSKMLQSRVSKACKVHEYHRETDQHLFSRD